MNGDFLSFLYLSANSLPRLKDAGEQSDFHIDNIGIIGRLDNCKLIDLGLGGG